MPRSTGKSSPARRKGSFSSSQAEQKERMDSRSAGEECLTDEQCAIVDAARRGESFKVAAFAGTGKTTSLTEAARALLGKRVLYLVFNKAQQRAAQRRFAVLKKRQPQLTIESRTAHSIAWRLFGSKRYRGRLARDTHGASRAWVAYLLERNLVWGPTGEARSTAAWAVVDTVSAFLASAAEAIGSEHLPARAAERSDSILNAARALWSELDDAGAAALPVTHDVYLKAWQLSRPVLPWCDVVMYDEAQDATPAMLDVVTRQRNLQTIYVGDEHQQIYEFRGAVNALHSLQLPEYPLTRTWRFGERIAALANGILQAKGEARRLRPSAPRHDAVQSGFPQACDLVLARTNVGLVEQALRFTDRKAGFFIRGATDPETGFAANGFGELRGRLLAAHSLWKGRETHHPAFAAFESWGALKRAAEADGGEAFRPYVRLVEQYEARTPAVVSALRKSSVENESEADVVLSTVHRFKGEEARRVALADDYWEFASRRKEAERASLDEGEANIAYVAVTRAMEELWMGGARATLESSLERLGVYSSFGS
ncbi:ATP-dependent helicase [bacterium]|nr:MAG: ATP-dependent helicase [bacterium]